MQNSGRETGHANGHREKKLNVPPADDSADDALRAHLSTKYMERGERRRRRAANERTSALPRG
jgi:hypothetical protein